MGEKEQNPRIKTQGIHIALYLTIAFAEGGDADGILFNHTLFIVISVLFIANEAGAVRPAPPPPNYKSTLTHKEEKSDGKYKMQKQGQLVDKTPKGQGGTYPFAEGIYMSSIAHQICNALRYKYKYDAKAAIKEQPYLAKLKPKMRMDLNCVERIEVKGKPVDVTRKRSPVDVKFRYSDCSIKRVDPVWGPVPIIETKVLAKRLVEACDRGGFSILYGKQKKNNKQAAGPGITRIEINQTGAVDDAVPQQKKGKLGFPPPAPEGETQFINAKQNHF